MNAQFEYKTPKYQEVEKSIDYSIGNKYQKDFLILKKLLDDVHPGYSNFLIDTEFKYFIDSSYSKLSTFNNDTTYYYYIQKGIALLNDGHTSLIPISENSQLPIGFAEFTGNIYVFKIGDIKFKDILGLKLAQINGIDIDIIFSRIKEFVSGDNEIKKTSTTTYLLTFKSMLERILSKRLDSVELAFEDGKKINIQFVKEANLKWVAYVNFKKNPITFKNRELFSYKIVDSICYFQWNSFYDSQTDLLLKEMSTSKFGRFGNIFRRKQQSTYPNFKFFLDSMFLELTSKQINTLVVDLRNNGGGNSIMGDQFLSYIINANNEDLLNYNSLIKKSQFLRQVFPSKYNSLKYYEFCSILNTSLFREESDKDNNQINRLFPKLMFPIYSGNVFFLSGKESFSSSVLLLTYIKDNKLFPIIGESPSMKPTSFGDILMYELPNTKLCGFVSTSYFERPEKSKNYEEFIMPDFKLIMTFQDFINGIDPSWNWIINNYPKK